MGKQAWQNEPGENRRHGGRDGFGFRRVFLSGWIVVRDFLGGRGCSRQQEDLIPFPAIDEYRERVCAFAEGGPTEFRPAPCHKKLIEVMSSPGGSF